MLTYKRFLISWFLAAFILGGPVNAVAAGVVEISQDCARNGGCLAGDTGGFPVTLTSAGHYKLTSPLNVDVSGISTPESVTAVRVDADDVTLDLNGFTISGPTTCSGGPPVTGCSPSGSGMGIDGTTAGASGTTVRDGTVRGMGSAGVRLGAGARLVEVRLRNNNDNGATLGDRSRAERCFAVANGIIGVEVGKRGRVVGSIAMDNASAGLVAGSESAVVGSVVRNNGTNGINADAGARIANNVVRGNGTSGQAGISIASDGGVVTGNGVLLNAGPGLDCGTTAGAASGYGGNVINTNNSSGTQVTGNCVAVDGNVCDNGASDSCP